MSSNAVRSVEEEMEFRRRRQGVFGGSDAPAVFGFSRFRNALDVYHAKTRPVREEDVRRDLEGQSIDQWRGHRNEPDAVRLYLSERGYEGRHESRQIYAAGSDRVAVHVDGTIYADDSREPPRDETGVIEAKSPRLGTFSRLISEGIGPYYLVQLQFNLAVTGRPWGALVIFSDQHDEGPIISVEAEADREFGRLMVERAEEFMRDHVEARVPPDPAEWDVSEDEETRAMLERSGEYEPVDDPAFLDGIARPLVENYQLKRDAESHYEDLRDEAQGWIEDNLETDAVLLPDGHKLRVVRREGRTYLDKGKLREHRPIDRDAFVRWIRRTTQMGDEQIEGLIADLELDFTRFERTSDPSAHIRCYPASD